MRLKTRVARQIILLAFWIGGASAIAADLPVSESTERGTQPNLVGSRVFYKTLTGPVAFNGVVPEVLVAMNVPAGSYVITAKALVQNTGTLQDEIYCNVDVGSQSPVLLDQSAVTLGFALNNNNTATLTNTVTYSSANPVYFSYSCGKLFAPGATVSYVQLEAISVGAVN